MDSIKIESVWLIIDPKETYKSWIVASKIADLVALNVFIWVILSLKSPLKSSIFGLDPLDHRLWCEHMAYYL